MASGVLDQFALQPSGRLLSDEAPASAAPQYLTDEQFLGSGYSTGAAPALAGSSGSVQPLPSNMPPPSDDLSDFDAAVADGAKAAPKYLTDEQFLGGSTPSGPGPLANSADDGLISGAAKGTATGIIKGISNNLGMVGNLSNFADYLVARGESAITGKPVGDVYNDIQSQRAAEEKASPLPVGLTDPRNVFPSGQQVAAPILAKTGEYQPASEPGRIAQAGVETAAGMVGPGMGAVAPGTSGLTALVKTPLSLAPATATAGAAGQGATDFTGDPLIGLGVGNAVAGLGIGAGRFAGSYVRSIMANNSPDVAATMAGGQLRARAANPEALERALTPGPMQPGTVPNYQLVNGSQPTLGQLTNDMGILQAERQARTADNSAFNLREGQQNTAQLGALNAARPAHPDTMAVPQIFQGQLAALDQAGNAAVDNLTSRASDLASGLGPTMTPEDRGLAIRNGLETVRQQVKAARSSLYRAVDPDGTLNAVATPIRQAGTQISSGIGQYAMPPSPIESGILNDAKNLPDVVPFRDLMDFDSRITTAMSQERRTGGETPSWGRLSQLKSASQSAINNAVENRQAYEAAQAAKTPNEQPDTIASRVDDWEKNLVDARSGFYSNRGIASQIVGRSGANGRNGSTTVPGLPGTASETGSGFPNPARNKGISPPPLQPNIGPEAASRLAAAKAAHAAYARAYREGPVAPVLATRGFKDNYTLPSAAVGPRAVVVGDRGYQTLKAFLAASKNDPNVISAAHDQLVAPLAKSFSPDGTLNPKGFEKWHSDYAPAIRAMDEARPGFSNRYKTAARATEEMMAEGVARKQAREAFEKTQAAKFIGKTNPIEVENQIGSLLGAKQNGPTQMRSLVTQARQNPAAFAGLQNAGIDWMLRQFSNAAEAPGTAENSLSAARFQKFVRDHQSTLAELYTPEQMNAFRAVSTDLARANRSVTATRIKGSPGTAKDIIPFRHPAENHTGEVVGPLAVFEEMREHLHEGAIGHALLIGGSAVAGLKFYRYLKAMRDAGIDKVQEAVKDALLNPERAKYYLGKSSPKEALGKWHALSSSVRRQLIMQPVMLRSSHAQ